MIPILTLRLLDIPMPAQPGIQKLLLNGAKDLLRSREELLRQQGLDIKLFHNQEVRYSMIQLGRYQQAPEWTAYGEEAVQLLGCWYELFKEEASLPLHNTIEIREQYTPAFLSFPKNTGYVPC